MINHKIGRKRKKWERKYNRKMTDLALTIQIKKVNVNYQMP